MAEKTEKAEQKNSGYQLKRMYNGFWYKGKLYRNEINGYMDEKKANELKKIHPKYEELFSKIPKIEVESKKTK